MWLESVKPTARNRSLKCPRRQNRTKFNIIGRRYVCVRVNAEDREEKKKINQCEEKKTGVRKVEKSFCRKKMIINDTAGMQCFKLWQVLLQMAVS